MQPLLIELSFSLGCPDDIRNTVVKVKSDFPKIYEQKRGVDGARYTFFHSAVNLISSPDADTIIFSIPGLGERKAGLLSRRDQSLHPALYLVLNLKPEILGAPRYDVLSSDLVRWSVHLLRGFNCPCST